MKCSFCGGKLKQDFVTFRYEDQETHIIVEHVPADVCSGCGEKLFSPEVTDTLFQLKKKQTEPVRILQVPVYDFAETTGI